MLFITILVIIYRVGCVVLLAASGGGSGGGAVE